MRRSRLMPLSGLFFNTGDRHEKTVDESFSYTRHYTDSINEGMMEVERLQHKKERDAKNAMQQHPIPNSDIKPNVVPGTKSGQSCL